ncbi:MAG TPA: PIG-L family deacetylase [Gemmatimonadaceae bacterium]|nr:PIG-L family deacetylase [Gemmatimonadaceae bacterium]
MNPYHRYVSELARLLNEGRRFPLGGFPLPEHAAISPNAARALIFSPHPDDECIIGGLALRLMREAGTRVVNVAVTQGSNMARRAGRREELKAACDYLGFDLMQAAPEGLENINLKTRTGNAAQWRASVDAVAAIIAEQQPQVMFFPHETDWNSTHIGTHYLLVDALSRQAPDFSCHVVETEFWGAMATPNLMVESSVTDLADMMTALSFHVGEVQRNPYHLLVPAWMQDNVRRGGELVGGQGGAAPDFAFSTLYRLRHWTSGALRATYEGGRTLAATESAATLLT